MDCFTKAGTRVPAVQNLIHGSTVAINTAIEEKGAATALVVTRGTRDVYKIGRQNRPDAYNFEFRRPQPLVPRSRTYKVTERLSARGAVLTALNLQELEDIARRIRDSEAEAVAVCFLHAYANPAHEIEAGRVLRRTLGRRVFISLSHEIVREYREYERISTTVMNAYIGPVTSEYIGRSGTEPGRGRFSGRFFIMQSSGGVMSPNPQALPVAMMESGPVGGVIAASEIGRRLALGSHRLRHGWHHREDQSHSDGNVPVAQGYHIGGYAVGHPVMSRWWTSSRSEQGAAGSHGSTRSARSSSAHAAPGSAPGPICYGLGGTDPTVTDANVILGRIGARSLLGGEMQLDLAAARRGVEEGLPKLGLDVAPRRASSRSPSPKWRSQYALVSVQRGHDPRDFAMMAMGGGGPMHALEMARDSHSPRRHSQSARTFLRSRNADERRASRLRPHLLPDAQQADFPALRAMASELTENGHHALDSAGADPNARALSIYMDLRYAGQEFAVPVPVEQTKSSAPRRNHPPPLRRHAR